jgi:transposase
VNPKKFPLYLKELEFRYNHRQHDLYDDLVKCISEYSRVASIQ